MRLGSILILIVATLTGHALADISVTSSLSQFHDVVPGEGVENSISIRNSGSADAVIRLYQTDYLFFADGRYSYGEPGTVSRSNAAWITLSTHGLTIPAGETVAVPYEVRVPDDQNLFGSYWSAIMVEEVTSPTPQGEGPVTVRTVVRYAVQVATEFGETGDSLLNFTNPSLLDTEAGGQLLQVDAENVGEQSIRASFYAELYDDQGALVARIDGRPRRTYPGTSIRQRFDLGPLVAGRYTALVVADGGGDELFGAQFTLNIE